MAKESVEDRLVGLADIVLEAAKKKKDPEFQIPVRALSNVEFNAKKRIIEMKSATTGLTMRLRSVMRVTTIGFICRSIGSAFRSQRLAL